MQCSVQHSKKIQNLQPIQIFQFYFLREYNKLRVIEIIKLFLYFGPEKYSYFLVFKSLTLV